ncbi:MAG: cytochrome c oxidase subunit II [Parvularculaceae bacterium]
MRVAIVIALLVAGSVAFHFLSPWWMTPIASNWGSIDNALIITFWVCGAVFIALNLFLAYAIFRFRHREGSRATYEPENIRLERRLTFGTAFGIVLMLAPGLLAWNKYISIPEDARILEARGQQWQWTFRFPGADGVLGTTAVEYVSRDNPFGVNPDDPWGLDDILVESGEVHLPVDRPVKVLLASTDVLHNFYVPQFRAKMDLVPGTTSYLWFNPNKEGTYEILCAEYCGVGHYAMRGYVVVEDEAAFEAWLSEFPTYGELKTAAADADGAAQ